MARTIILLMDSFGVGSALDADKYGDAGADTLGHIVEYCLAHKCDNNNRAGELKLPNLARHGLAAAAEMSRGEKLVSDLGFKGIIEGAYGYAVEKSKGKDTPSGHWEITGVPVMFDWGYFPRTIPTFPNKLISKFIEEAKIPGVLGNKHASGTEILDEFGEEHIKTGKPIVYTSADSVFQIAAHEKYFGLERLYEICEIARKLVDEYNIGRVIARPFVGEKKGSFQRTGNRHDISIPPIEETLLDIMKKNGGNVISIGKIADIFANSGITCKIKASGLEELFAKTLEQVKSSLDNSIIFTNFVDFDMVYGHRRDVAGYAYGLEYFDSMLPELEKILRDDDLVVITADHGCDPTWQGTDHTRENIPALFFGTKVKNVNFGKMNSFADIGQTIAKYMKLPSLKYGEAKDIFIEN